MDSARVERKAGRLPLRLRVAGPVAVAAGAVVVSVTDFHVRRRRDLPVVAAQGLRLAAGWYAMEGAMSLWLWSLPLQRRSGSITVWEGESHLSRFVRLPAHVAIMRRYRDYGVLRSTTWTSEAYSPADVLHTAAAWIGEAGAQRAA